jgi:hypothetical protein
MRWLATITTLAPDVMATLSVVESATFERIVCVS